MNARSLTATLAGVVALSTSGCGVPKFDIENTKSGNPTLYYVNQRITCELVGLIKDEPPGKKAFKFKDELLNLDYKVAMTLSLDVTDTGELAPTLSYSPTTVFSFGAGAKYAQSRTQNFTENLAYSMKDLRTTWESNEKYGGCPDQKSNLTGDLGIRNTVELAFTSPDRDETKDLSGNGEFGGSVNFDVTKNLNAVGPTWQLEHFSGPGGLGTLERKNTDKLTFAFAVGDGLASVKPTPADAANAKEFLRQLLLRDAVLGR
jgi:hypothetical protein